MTERTKYFIKQRLFGVVALLFGFVVAQMMGAWIWLLPFAGIGLAAIFSKEMLLTNDYSFEQEYLEDEDLD